MRHGHSTPEPVPVTSNEAPTHTDGMVLLDQFLHHLAKLGWEKCRVDTWRSPDWEVDIRHGYSGGEWRISTVWLGCQYGSPHTTHTIKYDLRSKLPTLEQLLAATINAGFDPAEYDANMERVLRGE